MIENHLPAAIQNFIEATNRGDSEAFVSAFSEDAYLNDLGREFHGLDGVRTRNRTDNIGARSHFELVSAERGTTPGSYTVTMTVTGDGFNGTGPMNFELHWAIASLRIGEPRGATCPAAAGRRLSHALCPAARELTGHRVPPCRLTTPAFLSSTTTMRGMLDFHETFDHTARFDRPVLLITTRRREISAWPAGESAALTSQSAHNRSSRQHRLRCGPRRCPTKSSGTVPIPLLRL
jgi:hypothetical protein